MQKRLCILVRVAVASVVDAIVESPPCRRVLFAKCYQTNKRDDDNDDNDVFSVYTDSDDDADRGQNSCLKLKCKKRMRDVIFTPGSLLHLVPHLNV